MKIPRYPIEALDRKTEQIRIYIPDEEIFGGLSRVVLAQHQPHGTGGEDEDEDEDQVLGRVALKIASKPKEIDLLVGEAEILDKLRRRQSGGSRIVRIGVEGRVLEDCQTGDAVIELEYLDGQTLDRWFEREWKKQAAAGPLETVETALRQVRQIAEALVELAAADIIHRDIKPDNIMRTSTGLRLFDFNVAREDQTGPMTQYVGTAWYMAPEVKLDDDYDQRADLYSLGVIFHELLMRETFSSSLLKNQNLGGSFVVPWDGSRFSELSAEIAAEIAGLIKGLITDRARRVESAEELLGRIDELEDSLRRHRLATAPPGAEEKALEGLDLIQLVGELRPSGQNAVVADVRELAPLQGFLRKRLRVKDPLEDWLAARIGRAAGKKNRHTLVVLAGNAGDGKSHLIEELIHHRLDQKDVLRDNVTYIADATHADHPSQSQQERLEGFFAPFAAGAPAPTRRVSLIAMNTGMVVRFFENAGERHRRGEAACGDLEPLYRALGLRLGLTRGRGPELSFDLLVVNLDLRDPMRVAADGSSFFEKMLDRLDPERDDGLLAETWPRCETCPALRLCPVHFNLESLRQPTVRRALSTMVELAALDPEVHLSPRLLWGFLYRIITGGLERYDLVAGESPCDVVRRRVDESDLRWLLAGHFSEILSAPAGRPDLPLWNALQPLDPAFSPAPELDRLHTRMGIRKYRDDSEEEIAALGGKDGELAGLHLRTLLAPEDLPLSSRRDAAIRRRVFFDESSMKAFSAWGAHREFRVLLAAYMAYSDGGVRALNDTHKRALTGLAEMIAKVFLRGCGRSLAGRKFLRVSQPHPTSTSHLMVEVEQSSFKNLFSAKKILQQDTHVLAHRDEPELLEHLGYRPSLVMLTLAGKRLLVDLELYEFLLQVQDGRQPSKRDLAQFEALLFIGEHIGNELTRTRDGGACLHVLDETSGALYKLHQDDFDTLTLERVSY